ncbi:DoxX family membrane protein, partial [uncultured Sulfitobacter sp.]
AGTLAEFVLPALIVLGLLTRFAALGMIGFVVLQSLTDLYGHGQWSALGQWFDRLPDGTILDQRGLWVLLLVVLVVKGGGPVALDRVLLARRR